MSALSRSVLRNRKYILNTVPVPTFDKLRFRFSKIFLKKSCLFYKEKLISFIKFIVTVNEKMLNKGNQKTQFFYYINLLRFRNRN
jgi:hypothetical protein